MDTITNLHYITDDRIFVGEGFITGTEQIYDTNQMLRTILGEDREQIVLSIQKSLASKDKQALSHIYSYDFKCEYGQLTPLQFRVFKDGNDSPLVFIPMH